MLKKLACLGLVTIACAEACTSAGDDAIEDAGLDALLDHAVDVTQEAATDARSDVGHDATQDGSIDDSASDVADVVVIDANDASVDAPADVDDGGNCTSTSDCYDSGGIHLLTISCAKAVGDCTGSGICTPVPDLLKCPSTMVSVCGCDDKTYTNACTASAFGVDIQYVGTCE